MAFGSPQWMYSSGSYELEQSLKFNDDDTAYLSKTFASSGDTKKWTYSCWYKRGDLDGQSHTLFSTNRAGSNDFDYIRVQTDDSVYVAVRDNSLNYVFRIITNRKLRDPSAWYHILVKFDSTASTPSSTDCALYINGVRETDLAAEVLPSQNDTTRFNSNVEHYVGQWNSDSSFYLDGHLAEVNFIDGQALTPADFGTTGTYGEWKPKEYSGTYGTNGFYLPFKQDYTVEGFSTITWKGNSTNNRYFGGVGFNSDLIWTKARSIGYSHSLYDSVRGYGSVHNLVTNTTEAENGGNHVYGGIASSSADGFTTFVGSDAGNPYANHNEDGKTYVAWNWDMGANTPTGFGCVTWTGDAVDGREISGVGFQPDLVWLKSRSDVDHNYLQDSVRGAKTQLVANETGVETNYTNGVKSFTPDGFTLGTSNWAGENNQTRVAWCWDMGNTTATNTSGSITSTVRANTTYGQSIVSYTGNGSDGATVGHGLSSAPDMVIVKDRNGTSSWSVGHVGLGTNEVLLLNQTSAKANCTTDFSGGGVGARGSSHFTLEAGTVNANNVNTNGNNYIAYCFHSVSGYSKFGTYSGTGNLAGPSVTLGFRPAWVMIRKTDSADWLVFDSTRNPLNEVRSFLEPNTSDVETIEQTTNYELGIDFDDNGFQIKARGGGMNSNGSTYIYAAFAGGIDSISDYNTDGSLDSRVKANPTYGQSIVSYTGGGAAATIGHGLSSAPEMVVVKRRESGGWIVGHESNGWGYRMNFESTAAKSLASWAWNDTAPTSSVFSVGSDNDLSASGGTYIAYCWHSVTGYSKFGSYNGDGTSDGSNTVSCGFEPAFVMIKCTNDTESWWMFDNARNPLNGGEDPKRIQVNSSAAETTGGSTGSDWVEFTSTGFKLTGSGGGTNGGSGQEYIYMAFADKREYAYWLDQSGNNNDWTSNNLTESDISVDSPTNNFATLNPLIPDANTTLSEGNLKIVHGSSFGGQFASQIAESGKWYAEYLVTVVGLTKIGIASANGNLSAGDPQNWSYAFWYNQDGTQRDGTTDSSYGASYTNGDIIGIKLDQDNNTIDYSKNGVYQGSISLSGKGVGTNPTFIGTSGRDATGIWNFGQDSSFAGYKTAQGNKDSNDIGDFYYTPPTGFLALCTDNLPDVAVTPSEHFNTVLWTGTTSVDRDITGIGFDPSFVWIKSRSDAYEQLWFDKVRGAGKRLMSHNTNAESTNDSTLNAFITDGFTLGNGSSVDLSVNGNTSKTYVAWNWKANGSGSSNTNGTITSTVSANVDAGFSIVSYTGNGSAGQTIGHGLSKTPEMVIVKARSGNASHWIIYHKGIASDAETDYLYFNTNAAADYADYWNDTAPTNTVFTVDTDGSVNGSSIDFIAYCFHSVDGYSKVGSYTGNGNADGTFVYTGFRPKFVMFKSASSSSSWLILDSARNLYNLTNNNIRANESGAAFDSSFGVADFLSNGFKPRANSNDTNANTYTYIYIAFAETPFKYSNAR